MANGLNPIAGLDIKMVQKIIQGNALLDEPATGQLSILKATSVNTFTRNTFLSTTYRNMITFQPNDPQPSYKFIATSSGSECGTQIFSPGTTLVGTTASHFFPRPFVRRPAGIFFSLYVKALPNQNAGPQSIFNIYLYARLKFFYSIINLTIVLQNVNSNSPAGELPWDGMPGGTREVRNELDGEDKDIFPFNLLIPFGIGLANVSYTAVEDFCFVPITSSLDITTLNLQALTGKYVAGVSPGNPSRAANFIAQEGPFTNSNGFSVNNNGHRFYTPRNANWIFNEMEGITPNDLNCSNNCQPVFTIVGDENLCTSNSYKFDQLPLNGTITWSSSNSSLVTLSSANSNPVTLTRVGGQAGYITLTATAIFCGQTIPKSKQIFVGLPDAPSIGPSNYDVQCGTFAEAYSTTPAGAIGHVWNLNYGQTIQDMNGNGSNYFYIAPFVNTPQQGQT